MNIETIYIDRSAEHYPLVETICSRLKRPVRRVDDAREVHERLDADKDPVGAGKRLLFLTRNKGAFLKDCPGTRNYICCGYRILHIGTFCTMDCSYCILQSYFHPPLLQLFVNQDDLRRELSEALSENKTMRIGTGEFTDSMIWEFWTDLSRFLVPVFAGQNRSVLELKTKTTAIDKLQGLEHNRKTIVAWSLNTPKAIKEQERDTASLAARLRAAEKCQEWGYPLAFHFDPMVIYPGCEKDYENVLEKLFARILPESIAWISLGTFRFPQSLKPVVERRFPESKILYGEFVKGMDGKARYFMPLRIKLYKVMADWMKRNAPDVLVYFCMEDETVWKKTFGFVPEEKGGLPAMLDGSAAEKCNLSV